MAENGSLTLSSPVWLMLPCTLSMTGSAQCLILNPFLILLNSLMLSKYVAFPNCLLSGTDQVVFQWLDHYTAHLEDLKKRSTVPQLISGTDAAKLIASSSYEPYDVVGFDQTEAKRLGLVAGQMVSMIPDDTGNNASVSIRLIG